MWTLKAGQGVGDGSEVGVKEEKEGKSQGAENIQRLPQLVPEKGRSRTLKFQSGQSFY